MHNPIEINNISLSFESKICFENFSAQINYGDRIAIIGRNGSGKTSLFKIIQSKLEPSSGQIIIPKDISVGYVEQTIDRYHELSGGQRLNKQLTKALTINPDILLLDEPTNHLDLDNRKSLMRMLKHYPGTLIIVSHDRELLRKCINIIWHIEDTKIKRFTGNIDNYTNNIEQQRIEIKKQMLSLEREKKDTHKLLMKEQTRAATSKKKGQKSIKERKWPTIVSDAKIDRASQTAGKKKAAIERKKSDLSEQLSDLKLPEIITPKFYLDTDTTSDTNILTIANANIGYQKDNLILSNIFLSLSSTDQIAITGNNASGKSTLLKAICSNQNLIISGDWIVPKPEHIGYLDQHYSNLNPNKTVIEHLSDIRPNWNHQELRQHLNDFLFRKNEEINNLVGFISGGEKARLSLCLIAAKPPKLLILDEITNNLDLETKQHITEVLKNYPGAMIIISHEPDFITNIGISNIYNIYNKTLNLNSVNIR